MGLETKAEKTKVEKTSAEKQAAEGAALSAAFKHDSGETGGSINPANESFKSDKASIENARKEYGAK